MLIEEVIHARLEEAATLVGGRIRPTRATTNTPAMPHMVYQIIQADNMLYNSGPSNVTKYTLLVQVYDRVLSQALDALAAVRTLLHGWRESPVLLCELVTEDTSEIQEEGYLAEHQYSLWANEDEA